jgi:ubiquinone/menaquinone biosynthesis C-methylase UbiE
MHEKRLNPEGPARARTQAGALGTASRVDWGSFSADEVGAFADAIAAVARELARAIPAPRGAPLFGLDMPLADPLWLDRFSRHGIFRKYQRAVAIDSGLGGIARWWTVHFGCTVLAADPHPGPSAAAARLGAAAGLGERAAFRNAPAHNLPGRAEQFTHAWSVEGLGALTDPDPALAELMRVLRPAGMLSAIVPGAGDEDEPVRAWVNAVDRAGFLSIAVRRLPPPELPYTVLHAEHVLRATISATCAGARRERLLELARALDAARGDRTPRVMVFAEKPS